MRKKSRIPFTHIGIAAFLCALLVGTGCAFADEQMDSGGDPSTPALCAVVQSNDEGDFSTSDLRSSARNDETDVITSDADAASPVIPSEANAASPVITSDADVASPVIPSEARSAESRDLVPDAADPTETTSTPVDDPLVATGTLETVPVYRLYNPNAGDHHYTLSTFERDDLIDEGWNDEGIGWYSDDSERIAVLRQYNPNADSGSHNFTTSENEDEALGKAGWECEGIAWYAVAEGNTAISMSYIYLDAGHGMGSSTKGVYDPGAGGNGYEEAELTAELVDMVAQYARDLYGLKVYSNVDTNVEYFNRQEDALDLGCTSLVSIHFNASEGGATGSESYIHSRNAAPGATQLQTIMHKYLVSGTGLRDRGKKNAALAVCSGLGTNIPGTLLEVCFIDNSYDMKQYQKRKDTIARELAAGLYEAAKNGF